MPFVASSPAVFERSPPRGIHMSLLRLWTKHACDSCDTSGNRHKRDCVRAPGNAIKIIVLQLVRGAASNSSDSYLVLACTSVASRLNERQNYAVPQLWLEGMSTWLAAPAIFSVMTAANLANGAKPPWWRQVMVPCQWLGSVGNSRGTRDQKRAPTRWSSSRRARGRDLAQSRGWADRRESTSVSLVRRKKSKMKRVCHDCYDRPGDSAEQGFFQGGCSPPPPEAPL